MNANILNTAYLAVAFLALFASAELLYHKYKVKAEVTRKYVHIVTGLLTMLFPLLISDQWLVLALCGSFLVILLASKRLNLLPSINAVDRNTTGSILYPIVVFICYAIYMSQGQFVYFYIPILILALCDPVAAFVGKKWPGGQYITFGHRKTLTGSLGFFFAAMIVSVLLIISFEALPFGSTLAISAIIAAVTSVSEALSHRGYDNLTIPASALLVLALIGPYKLIA